MNKLDMRVVIPTRGRYSLTLTCDRLPKEWRDRVDLVCPEREAKKHQDVRPWAHVVVQPDPDCTIAAKRAWIMRTWSSDRIVMMDDDLQFFVKTNADPRKLRGAEHADIAEYLSQLETVLDDEMPHAGFGSRLFNNNKESGWHGPGRMQYVLGYYLPTVREHCELGRIETREDMDYTLQLLRAGFPNTVCDTFVVEQARGYGAKGGCDGQRTTEAGNADAARLAELHPGFVRVVKKDYKGHPRDEVACRWADALRSGKERQRDAGAVRDQAKPGRKSRG